MRHKEKMKYFDQRKDNLETLRENLDKYQDELEKYENINYYDCSFEDISRKSELKTLIDKTNKEIYDIENNVEEMNYYSDTVNLLCDYYSIIEDDPTTISKKSDNGVSIMDFLSKKKEKRILQKMKQNQRIKQIIVGQLFMINIY